MNNRAALGLAVSAGYVLGRRKKAKLAIGLGTLAMGKRLHLSPQGVAELVRRQVGDNPQVKEIGDQLREELRGVGQAATGALVTRRINALADRLHERTQNVQDLASRTSKASEGAVSGVSGVVSDLGREEEREERDEAGRRGESEEPRGDQREEEPEDLEEEAEEEPTLRKTAEKAAGKAVRTAEKVTGRKAPRAPVKAPARKTAGKKPLAKRAADQTGTAARRMRAPKGGGGGG
jgi:hypothetical protein